MKNLSTYSGGNLNREKYLILFLKTIKLIIYLGPLLLFSFVALCISYQMTTNH